MKGTLTQKRQEQLLETYKKAIQTRSYSNEEEKLAKFLQTVMLDLDFDEVHIDRVGNVVGRVGNGPVVIHFDSHMDTVAVSDAEEWTAPPFEAKEVDGMIYGRGSVDMKGGLTASIFAAANAKEQGWLEGKTVYVTGSVCEEYCDGVCLENFYADHKLVPDYSCKGLRQSQQDLPIHGLWTTVESVKDQESAKYWCSTFHIGS